jgi:hypothetical protein
MKTYIVYLNGEEVGYIKAENHNRAEKKAREKYSDEPPHAISVVYTEI